MRKDISDLKFNQDTVNIFFSDYEHMYNDEFMYTVFADKVFLNYNFRDLVEYELDLMLNFTHNTKKGINKFMNIIAKNTDVHKRIPENMFIDIISNSNYSILSLSKYRTRYLDNYALKISDTITINLEKLARDIEAISSNNGAYYFLRNKSWYSNKENYNKMLKYMKHRIDNYIKECIDYEDYKKHFDPIKTMNELENCNNEIQEILNKYNFYLDTDYSANIKLCYSEDHYISI